jgi:hypothetical protein
LKAVRPPPNELARTKRDKAREIANKSSPFLNKEIQMQLAALKRIQEFSETAIEITETVYIIKPGETVEELMFRAGLDGKTNWHRSHAEVTIKIVEEKA